MERCIKSLYAYFDLEAESTAANEHVHRINKLLKDPLVKLICHFVSFALKPLNKFTVSLQTSASHIGSLQSDILCHASRIHE